jgi:hypothetical protein
VTSFAALNCDLPNDFIKALAVKFFPDGAYAIFSGILLLQLSFE